MRAKFFKIGIFLFLGFLLIFSYFFVGKVPEPSEIKWGVNFSQKHSQNLGLDWKENYLAILDDLKVKYLKLATYWDLLEPEKDDYHFEDLDWQIEEAKKRKIKVLLIIGMKTPRWPECHIPGWAIKIGKENQQKEILEILEKIVLRYKNEETIFAWQVENEPFFPFGSCPWFDKKFLKTEINLVKSLDPLKRPVILTDSGEFSFWFQVAKMGDIVGTTIYKKVWSRPIKRYFEWFLPPGFYWKKAILIKKIFGKKVIVIELQAEPWGPTLLYDLPYEEQKKSMDLKKFLEILDFAKKTGFDEFYLWGSEWWYWLKKNKGDITIWEEAKKLF